MQEREVPDKEEKAGSVGCEQNSQAPGGTKGIASEEGTKETYTVASTRGSGSRARDGDCKGRRRVHVTAPSLTAFQSDYTGRQLPRL
jgi:hypothetical protein